MNETALVPLRGFDIAVAGAIVALVVVAGTEAPQLAQMSLLGSFGKGLLR